MDFNNLKIDKLIFDLKLMNVLRELCLKFIRSKTILTIEQIKECKILSKEEIFYNEYKAKEKKVNPVHLVNIKLKNAKRYRLNKDILKLTIKLSVSYLYDLLYEINKVKHEYFYYKYNLNDQIKMLSAEEYEPKFNGRTPLPFYSIEKTFRYYNKIPIVVPITLEF